MKLQPLLSKYLLEHGQLPLADAGYLYVNHTGAVIKDDGTVEAPKDTIAFSTTKAAAQEQQELVAFISDKLKITTDHATTLLEQEANLQSATNEDGQFNWDALGSFQKQQDGTFSFVQDNTIHSYLPLINIAPKPQSITTETVTEVYREIITEPLQQSGEPVQQSRWWIWAIIIFIVSVALILIRYSMN